MSADWDGYCPEKVSLRTKPTPANRLTRLVIIVVMTLLLASCGGSSPNEPTRTTLPVTGTWKGTYRVTNCTANFTIIPCMALVPEATTMQLVLTQTGTNVAGTLTSDVLALGTPNPPTLPMTGEVDSSGKLHLQGGQPFRPGCHDPATSSQVGYDIGDWITTMNPAGTSLSGAFRQSVTGAYLFSCYVATIDFQTEIISVNRSSGP